MKRTVALLALWSLMALTCAGNSSPVVEPERDRAPADLGFSLAQPVYDRGLQGTWMDFGWSRRELKDGQPVRVDMVNYGGWIVMSPGLDGAFDALAFKFRGPKQDFLEVAVSIGKQGDFPGVRLAPRHRRPLLDGWIEVLVPMKELNPQGRRFDRIIIRAHSAIPSTWVEIDGVGLWATSATAREQRVVQAVTAPTRSVELAVDCDQPTHAISPEVFSIAYYPMEDRKSPHVWSMNPAARRWGGNHTSRYNWRLGNAWNTAFDWFFTNVNYTGEKDFSWTTFLDANAKAGVKTALTIPMIGWVAKDVGSYAFPVSVLGKQQAIDPHNPDAGNGKSPDGKDLKPLSPTRTSVELTPADVEAWVREIRRRDAASGRRSVDMYLLDNEPDLWHVTHRDVHPEPVTYDELLERTIAYASAIRRADPDAVIGGPSSWGWTGYFYSAADQVSGFRFRPDRRRHGDVPLLEWYLRRLAEHERKTGMRLLDVLNVHFYPQGDGIYGGHRTDPDTAARRLRSTRALWDPSYQDESWIGERIQLLPRLAKIIDDNYPGRRLSIGEWSFGAEGHISGGLATAEALGRLASHPKVAAAYYWTYPPAGSPSFMAFRAFRNYDGKSARFQDVALAAREAEGVSLFASRDETKEKVVAIALNLDQRAAIETGITIASCGPMPGLRAFRYTASGADLAPAQPAQPWSGSGRLVDVLPPESITVYELSSRAQAASGPGAPAAR